MTRNPERIDPILELLREEWHAHPDLRFGQLVVNLFGADPFYLKDTSVSRTLAERQGAADPLADDGPGIDLYVGEDPWPEVLGHDLEGSGEGEDDADAWNPYAEHPDPELVEQADQVRSLVLGTLYPVAHGEAIRLEDMLEEHVD